MANENRNKFEDAGEVYKACRFLNKDDEIDFETRIHVPPDEIHANGKVYVRAVDKAQAPDRPIIYREKV